MTENLLFIDDNWQRQLAEAFHSVEALCDYLALDRDRLPLTKAASDQFPLRVPRSFADCMEQGNPDDPLLRQVLPVTDEMITYPGYTHDPVGDQKAAQPSLILHKYHGRVLMINTGSCAINCRYCFRRNFPYAEFQLSPQKQKHALDYIRGNDSIAEVILSGGDPLLLSDAKLAGLLDALNAIDHVRRIRIHSRLPIVLPARITPELCKILARSPKNVVMVVHCNHANELSRAVAAACSQLKAHTVTLFNQAVLLKQVNDNADTLHQLSEKLFTLGIIPYYLHLLDKAVGTGHFEVSETFALQLMEKLQNTLPGYLVPKLVREITGAPAKQIIFKTG
ncbi:MAG: EF-P beta-lysylation protein EpmB [Gammaproteobacteria bacterium HGW-Gammaproteobacteria-3]|jgi:EF-P beta-lysylation protein EpmB|nr:MAG: EF-P beta-lysylation protein EpmB [Gammaproteobacteria bacterium HGW-Gammaproteobacteria-3]